MTVPSKVSLTSVTNPGPHATTVRFTYTVPAGRFAELELLAVLLYRNAGAGVAGQWQGYIQYTPSGGAANVLLNLVSNLAAVDTNGHREWGGTMKMQAGDKLEAITFDLSTGGAAIYVLSAVATEYDV